MSVTVRDTDRGLAARLAALRDFDRWVVVVGVLADEGARPHEDSDLTVLDIATIHEFGAPAAGIPQRSFVRATVDEHRADIARIQRALAARVIAGKLDVRGALEQLGAKVVGLIQTRIAAGIAPPNAPATVERKGSATPLVDSGQLRGSVTYAVRARGGA